jgi:hypothetical protein
MVDFMVYEKYVDYDRTIRMVLEVAAAWGLYFSAVMYAQRRATEFDSSHGR